MSGKKKAQMRHHKLRRGRMHARKYVCQETAKHSKEKVKDKETKRMREGSPRGKGM